LRKPQFYPFAGNERVRGGKGSGEGHRMLQANNRGGHHSNVNLLHNYTKMRDAQAADTTLFFLKVCLASLGMADKHKAEARASFSEGNQTHTHTQGLVE